MTVNNNSTSNSFFQPADTFFQQAIPFGLTFDDLSLATLYSEVLPRETNLSTKISDSLELQIPIISSDMDTVRIKNGDPNGSQRRNGHLTL